MPALDGEIQSYFNNAHLLLDDLDESPGDPRPARYLRALLEGLEEALTEGRDPLRLERDVLRAKLAETEELVEELRSENSDLVAARSRTA